MTRIKTIAATERSAVECNKRSHTIAISREAMPCYSDNPLALPVHLFISNTSISSAEGLLTDISAPLKSRLIVSGVSPFMLQ